MLETSEVRIALGIVVLFIAVPIIILPFFYTGSYFQFGVCAALFFIALLAFWGLIL